MSNLVKQSQLSEIVVALWEKVKQRTDVALKDATYDKTTQTITFTKIDDTTVEVPLTDLVSKSNANVITGETLITDGYILGGVISKLDNQINTLTPASLPHHFGLKSAQVRTGQKLTHITIGIHDSIAVGTQITGIKVGAIKVSDNTITQYVINDGTATVKENKNTQLTNCTRAVVVPLDTPFVATEDTWFCVTCLNAAWGERSAAMFKEDACAEAGAMPNIGSLVIVKRSGWLGKYLLHTDKISLNEIANIPDLQTELDKIKENFVEHWGDLEYTISYKYINLLDYDSRVQGKYFPNSNGDVQDNWTWSIFHCPVVSNEEYTILRKYNDSGRFVFYNAQGGIEQVLDLDRNNLVNGWYRNYVQVPDNSNIAHMAFCFQTYDSGLNVKGRIMLLKASNVTEELDFIPYLPNEKVVIDGDKVSIQFDNSGTSLQSNNLVGAVKELKNLIDSSNDKNIHVVENKVELDGLLPTITLKTGDIIYIIDSTGVVDYEGNDVNNGGKSVAMIYDGNITDSNSNKLRLFSKLEDKLHIDWNILSYTTTVKCVNLFDVNKIIKKVYYQASGGNANISYDVNWCSYNQKCKTGDTFRIAKRQHDSSTVVFLDENKNIVSTNSLTRTTVNGWQVYDVTVPSNTNIKYMGFNLHKPTLGTNGFKDNVMLFEGHTETPKEICEYSSGGHVVVDGSEVNLTFDNSDTTLESKFVDEAIVELDDKKADKIPFGGLRVFDSSNNIWDSVYFRIPSLLRTQNGTLLGFGDVRYNTGSDHSYIDVGCARSIDNGLTWDYRIAVNNDRVNQTYSRVMDSTAVVTNTNKVLLLVGSWNDGNSWTSGSATPKPDWDIILAESTDDGITWSQRSIKDTCNNVPSNKLGWLGGVGAGIVLKHEQHRNRIVLPTQIALRSGSTTNYYSCCIYSDDDGATWTMSGQVPNTKTSENMILELNSGELIMNSRKDGSTSRNVFISSDGGETWSVYAPLTGVFTHGLANRSSSCQGSWIKYVTKNGHEIGLASYPKNTLGSFKRDNITIYMYDFTHPGSIRELLVPYPKAGNAAGAGYSCLNYGLDATGKECLSILFEDDGNLTFKDITYLLETIEDIVLSEQKCSWEDLDHVVEIKEDYTFENLFADDPKWTGKTFLSNGNLSNSSQYRARAFRVEYGKTYRFMNVRGENNNTTDSITGSATCVEFNTNNNTFNSSTRVASGQWRVGSDKVCGRSYLEYTPTNANVTHISINLQYTVLTGVEDEIMVWDASVTPHKPYIPGTQTFTKSIIIDGDEVETEYNSLQGLTSTKLKEALEELANRITNSGGGTLTSINSQTGTNGNIDLSISETNEALKLNVSGTEVGRVQYLTESEVNEISKKLFIYLR